MASKTLEQVRAQYDQWHLGLGAAGVSSKDLEAPWYEWARRVLPDLGGLRVLEIACGRGPLVGWMSGRGAFAVGCDVSWEATRMARSSYPGHFATTDIQSLPFPDNTFDLVVCCETLEHTLDLNQSLRELLRVARPGAGFLISTPNYLNTTGLYRIYLRLRGHPYESCGRQPVERVLLAPMMRWLLKRHGLSVRQTEGLVHYLRPGVTRLRFVERRPVLARWLKYFALHFAVVAEVRKKQAL